MNAGLDQMGAGPLHLEQKPLQVIREPDQLERGLLLLEILEDHLKELFFQIEILEDHL